MSQHCSLLEDKSHIGQNNNNSNVYKVGTLSTNCLDFLDSKFPPVYIWVVFIVSNKRIILQHSHMQQGCPISLHISMIIEIPLKNPKQQRKNKSYRIYIVSNCRVGKVNAKLYLILYIGIPRTYINFLHPLYKFWHRSFNSSAVSSREYNCSTENK